MIKNINSCQIPYTSPLDNNNNKTSVLNVLVEDGFNIFQVYYPNEWRSEVFVKKYLELSAANNIEVLMNSGHYYKPSGLYVGENVYDNCGFAIDSCEAPFNQNFFRAHIDNFMQHVFTQSPYKDIIWGYQISEEAASYHYHHNASNCSGHEWQNSSYFSYVEVPPTNVNQALNYYKNNLANNGIYDKKTIILEANHHKNINSNTVDTQGQFNIPQYIQLLNPNDNRDVFFESSYTQFPDLAWLSQNYDSMFTNNYHYLGPFRSIDYAKSYASEVHKVIDIEGSDSDDYYVQFLKHYHSNISIPNANWLWFQTYTSVIHGVSGIWFWDLNYVKKKGESEPWPANNNSRFERQYFPENYKLYVSHLAKELRFLVNNNFISTDQNTIIATKTDSVDVNCIVPPASTYIPSKIGKLFLPPEKRTEKYGLRYTIRCNGEETIMIISNPLNVSLTVPLDFSVSSNPQIQSAIGAYVLFENNSVPVNSISYKTDRDSNIDLANNTVGNKYFLSFTNNKTLTLSFGPLDVKILKFVSGTPPDGTGWSKVWSNQGNGKIDGHTIRENDIFYIGDFDGDGTEELLCIGHSSSGDKDWINLLKFNGNDWTWVWSNNGNSNTVLYSYRDNFIVGDFDGDGKDDILGNNPNGWTTLFTYTGSSWGWIWSDYGNTSHDIRPYKSKLYAGDFDGDGKDELLGCALPNGWTTMFQWNGNDFSWKWSNYGSTNVLDNYRNDLLVGDFLGNGRDDVLGFSSWATLFSFSSNNWQYLWSTYGNDNFAGWTYPFLSTDVVLPGNIDSDTKDELLLIQTQPNAGWALSTDYQTNPSDWYWNWSANNIYSTPYINDWPINPSPSGTNTRYMLIKLFHNSPKCLLAIRKFCRNYLANIYQPVGNYNYLSIPSDTKNHKSNPSYDISIFPNPAKSHINITSQKSSINNVYLLNSQGTILSDIKCNSTHNIKLDVSNYPNGYYLVKIFTDSGIFYRKLIILN